jgi:hypothetical protein
MSAQAEVLVREEGLLAEANKALVASYFAPLAEALQILGLAATPLDKDRNND